MAVDNFVEQAVHIRAADLVIGRARTVEAACEADRRAFERRTAAYPHVDLVAGQGRRPHDAQQGVRGDRRRDAGGDLLAAESRSQRKQADARRVSRRGFDVLGIFDGLSQHLAAATDTKHR